MVLWQLLIKAYISGTYPWNRLSKKKINSLCCHLDTYLQSTGIVSSDISTTASVSFCFTEYCQLFKVGRCSLLCITLCTYSNRSCDKQRTYTIMYKGCYGNSSTLHKPTNEGLLYANSFTITRTAVYLVQLIEPLADKNISLSNSLESPTSHRLHWTRKMWNLRAGMDVCPGNILLCITLANYAQM